MIAAALATIGTWFASVFTVSVARYLAWKAFTLFLVVVVLPIVINNIIYKIIQTSVELVSNNIGDTSFLSSMTIHFTGLAAYVVGSLHLPEALSIVMSAVALRFTLSFFSFRNMWVTR